MSAVMQTSLKSLPFLHRGKVRDIYAVGDDNNDGTYAADHESFGAYPTRDSPTAVHVGSDSSSPASTT